MRLIDSDALIDCIRDDLYDRAGYWYKMIADALIEVIKNMPTIKTDPEPAGYDDSHLDQIVDDMLHGDKSRTYNADDVDALFDGCTNPLHPTDEDRHKAYARLMLRTLK